MKNYENDDFLYRLVAILILIITFFVGCKFYIHEKYQDTEISLLKSEILILKGSTSEVDTDFLSAVNGGGYNYLAIGNSITLHPITDFWWSHDGMAATAPSFDYFHLVCTGLERRLLEENESKNSYFLNAKGFNYYEWEILEHDRSETYNLLDPYLVPEINLVTVQLSENCVNLDSFEVDFKSLLRHIEEQCGEDVQIIVIDDFWSEEKHNLKRSVCLEMAIPFVDLSDLRGRNEYTAGIGTIVEGDDGNTHVIEHSGVANHPGDEGMKVIAERILEMINY